MGMTDIECILWDMIEPVLRRAMKQVQSTAQFDDAEAVKTVEHVVDAILVHLLIGERE
jgi:hypothetical protein